MGSSSVSDSNRLVFGMPMVVCHLSRLLLLRLLFHFGQAVTQKTADSRECMTAYTILDNNHFRLSRLFSAPADIYGLNTLFTGIILEEKKHAPRSCMSQIGIGSYVDGRQHKNSIEFSCS